MSLVFWPSNVALREATRVLRDSIPVSMKSVILDSEQKVLLVPDLMQIEEGDTQANIREYLLALHTWGQACRSGELSPKPPTLQL